MNQRNDRLISDLTEQNSQLRTKLGGFEGVMRQLGQDIAVDEIENPPSEAQVVAEHWLSLIHI